MSDGDSVGATLVLTESDDETAIGACLEAIVGPEPRGRDVVIVTYDLPPETVLEAWRGDAVEGPQNLGLVAVGNAMRSAAQPADADDARVRTVVRGVSDPTEYGTTEDAIAAFLDGWNDAGSDPVVYVESLPSVVRAVGVEATASFVEDVTAMLETYDCPAYFRAAAGEMNGTMDRLENVFDRVQPVRGSASDVTSSPRHEREDAERLSMDDVFELLSAKRRRLVLHVLRREETPMPVASLAKHVARLEAGAVTHDSDRRTYVALRHVHLPKLEERGIVTVDWDRNVVETLPDGIARVEPALSLAAAEDIDDTGS